MKYGINPLRTHAERPKPTASALTGLIGPACEACYKGGIKCRVTAVLAVVENGDYVPVCAYHSSVAGHAGWKIGTLRHNGSSSHAAGIEKD